MTTPATPLGDNARGALWMTASMAVLIVNDTLMKSVSGEVPVFQAIFVRGVVATLLIALLAWYRGALARLPRGPDRRLIGLRMVGEIGGTSLYLTALFHMPLANATAIAQTAPLTVTLAAAWVLGHAVGWRRYTAIAVGFAGVLLIVRPGGEGFNAYALVALGAVLFVTLREISTRGLSPAVPSLLVTVVTSAAITAFAGVVTAFSDWEPMGASALARLAGASVLLIVAYYTGIMGMRVGEIGFVSPFRYSNLVWALALGYVVFGEVPGWATLLGVAVIVATGVYTLHRERVSARAAIAARAMPATPAPASAACRDGAPPAARRAPR